MRPPKAPKAHLAIAIAVALAAMAIAAPEGALAQDAARPLIMEGKKTLYQRVISHPGALVRESPDGAPGQPVKPFTVLYVYERRDVNGRLWF
ncbi:MAG: hypothetical protein LBR80_09910, partial [Deltaproteobacteria bacterium]|nr:hypothetical protein [Deltaproteobacteria bacterium]